MRTIEEVYPVQAQTQATRTAAAVTSVLTPRAARHWCMHMLQAWDAPADTADAVLLVVSELVTNAIRHAGAGAVRVELTDLADRLLVVVGDPCGTGGPRLVHAAVQDERGRGMAIVDALSLDWGWSTTASGKVVWAEVAAT